MASDTTKRYQISASMDIEDGNLFDFSTICRDAAVEIEVIDHYIDVLSFADGEQDIPVSGGDIIIVTSTYPVSVKLSGTLVFPVADLLIVDRAFLDVSITPTAGYPDTKVRVISLSRVGVV